MDQVDEWPLALCDFQSLDVPRDLRASDLIREDYEGETFVAHYNESHSWYYASDQSSREGWMMKLYDSEKGVATSESGENATQPWSPC